MKQFNELTKGDVEMLRRKPMYVPAGMKGIDYNFTSRQIDEAVEHLKTLYTGIIRETFAAKIRFLFELYKEDL